MTKELRLPYYSETIPLYCFILSYMSQIAKILGKKSLAIKYRWKVGDSYTGWTTYKKFKTEKKLRDELDRLKADANEFVEYKAVC